MGYGCTTCIGNSGPLPEEVSRAIEERKLVVCSVLSGNRNFEGRVHTAVQMNYLASPPLVVAYAIAGRMDIDLCDEPVGLDAKGVPVYLKEIWPSGSEIQEAIAASIGSDMFRSNYSDIFAGDGRWNSLDAAGGNRFAWDDRSTYVKEPPFFLEMGLQPAEVGDIKGARVLVLLGDSITTDHISPAGAITEDSPAGRYLVEQGLELSDFNSYGSRRGNHEVMMRGTFANVRLRNRLAPGTEGGWTTCMPSGEVVSIFDAATHYRKGKVPLIVLAGKEYGSGSSRDWAAKGPQLLGVRAVIAESFERIHRSNLIGMGVLPLQFMNGENAGSLGLSGTETFDIEGVGGLESGSVTVNALPAGGGVSIRFRARVCVDTDRERLYYRHGGILQYVLRQLMEEKR